MTPEVGHYPVTPPPLRGRKTRLDFCTSQKSNLPRQVGGVSPRVPLSLPPTPALPLKGGGREEAKSWVELRRHRRWKVNSANGLDETHENSPGRIT